MLTSNEFITNCKNLVATYTDKHTDVTDHVESLAVEDVYVVWYCKTLQNHKALLSTTRPDGMYYEVTYNGDKDELYFDAYKKFENMCVKLTTLSAQQGNKE